MIDKLFNLMRLSFEFILNPHRMTPIIQQYNSKALTKCAIRFIVWLLFKYCFALAFNIALKNKYSGLFQENRGG